MCWLSFGRTGRICRRDFQESWFKYLHFAASYEKRDRRIALELVYMVTDASFEIYIFKEYLELLTDLNDVFQKGKQNIWRIMDFKAFSWIVAVPETTMMAHRTWQVWLRHCEIMSKFAKKCITSSVQSRKCMSNGNFFKFDCELQSNMLRRTKGGDVRISAQQNYVFVETQWNVN